MSHKRSRTAYEADLPANEHPFVSFGTPLPPADDHVQDDGSYVPIHKQEVRDEQGRRRLHGAFTGGWSAGYYNTVGSKEGWTPATFVSSRSARHKDNTGSQPQRPEDFMDDEDREAAADAEKIQLSDIFSAGQAGSNETLGKGLAGLMCPDDASLGLNLLRRMGWKDGQGIGPRVRRLARLHDTQAPGKSVVKDSHLFAPDDVGVVSVVKKTDHDGLGYQRVSSRISREATRLPSPTRNENDLDIDNFTVPGASRSQVTDKPEKTNSVRGSFGVGVLNDNGSDEDDIYQMAPRISYTAALVGTKKKKKNKLSNAVSANPVLGSRPVFKSRRVMPRQRDGRLCRDGVSPLSGFVLARTDDSRGSLDSGTTYSPPTVPKGWLSSRFGAGKGLKVPDGAPPIAPNATSHDPRSRALALGEAPLPGKSIFDFLSTAARERLVAVSGRTNLPAAGGEAPPGRIIKDNPGPDARQKLPILDRETAIAALDRGKGTRGPYADDETKQSRYRAYLEHAAGFDQDYPSKPESSTEVDFARELEEFHGCAQLFKPMTGLMATRFTTSTSLRSPPVGKDVVEAGARRSAADTPRPQDPAEQAALLGMYGQVTRSEQEFFPTRLLCKRFNVRPPEHTPSGPASTKMQSATDSMPLGTSPLGIHGHLLELPGMPHVETPPPLISRDALGHVSTATPMGDTLGSTAHVSDGATSQKPSEDVFRAIFGEDSDNE